MNKKLFRKSSVDRVNSPEQLNEYIRIANPSVWLVLAAIVVLLVGVLIWGIFGTVETTIETGMIVEGSAGVCYVSAQDAAHLKEGMMVSANGITGKIKNVASTPVQIDETFSDYILYLTGFVKDDFCHAVEVELPTLEEGIYAAVITVDSTRPISFVIH